MVSNAEKQVFFLLFEEKKIMAKVSAAGLRGRKKERKEGVGGNKRSFMDDILGIPRRKIG